MGQQDALQEKLEGLINIVNSIQERLASFSPENKSSHCDHGRVSTLSIRISNGINAESEEVDLADTPEGLLGDDQFDSSDQPLLRTIQEPMLCHETVQRTAEDIGNQVFKKPRLMRDRPIKDQLEELIEATYRMDDGSEIWEMENEHDEHVFEDLFDTDDLEVDIEQTPIDSENKGNDKIHKHQEFPAKRDETDVESHFVVNGAISVPRTERTFARTKTKRQRLTRQTEEEGSTEFVVSASHPHNYPPIFTRSRRRAFAG